MVLYLHYIKTNQRNFFALDYKNTLKEEEEAMFTTWEEVERLEETTTFKELYEYVQTKYNCSKLVIDL